MNSMISLFFFFNLFNYICINGFSQLCQVEQENGVVENAIYIYVYTRVVRLPMRWINLFFILVYRVLKLYVFDAG